MSINNHAWNRRKAYQAEHFLFKINSLLACNSEIYELHNLRRRCRSPPARASRCNIPIVLGGFIAFIAFSSQKQKTGAWRWEEETCKNFLVKTAFKYRLLSSERWLQLDWDHWGLIEKLRRTILKPLDPNRDETRRVEAGLAENNDALRLPYSVVGFWIDRLELAGWEKDQKTGKNNYEQCTACLSMCNVNIGSIWVNMRRAEFKWVVCLFTHAILGPWKLLVRAKCA